MSVQIKNPGVKMNRTNISGIPVIELRPETEIKGGIIFYHGWSSSKENQIFRASTIASHGYCVLVPDAAFHGNRGEIDYDDEEVLARYFFPILIKSVRESEDLLNYFVDKLKVKKSFGVIGHSMGGFIAGGVIVADDRVNTMINVNGSCAWAKTRDLLLEEQGAAASPAKKANLLNIEGEQVDIENFDPYYNISKLAQRPILMLHGEEDTSVPYVAQNYFYKKARKYYEREENIKLELYENLNHYFTTGMLESSIGWFNNNL